MTEPTESREWLRVILSSIGDAVITTDADGAITFLNPVAETLTGWTSDQALGKDLALVFRIVNEETRQEIENPALRALRAGLVVGLGNHTLLIAKDGTERPVDDSAAPIRNDNGDTAGVVLVFRDITERREQEHAVHHALEYAQGILSTIRESLVVLHSDLRVKSANRSFYKTFHVSPHEVEGRFIYDIGNRQWDIPELRTLLEEVLPQNHSFEEFEVKHEFEGIGPKCMVLNARRVQEGEELILLAIEDATERRDAQRRLLDSELRYRRLFETAQDGILILNADNGKITEANPYVAGLIGLRRAELIGKELWEIGLFRDIQENKATFERLRRDGYVQYDHLPLNSVKGETIPVEFVSNMYREDGHLVAQCNVRSIGERRLRDQNRALAEENRRKDEFLAVLSHELRNPLAPIRSAVHLLRTRASGGGESEDPVQQQAREIIERQVGNLTKLVNDLLEVSRVLSGRIHLDMQLQDLNHLLLHAIETIRPMVEQRKHKVTFHSCRKPVWVDADATRMEEVFINILTNAVKYTPEGGKEGNGGEIDVWCEQGSGGHGDDGEHVQVRIRDNGVGIDRVLLPRIFDLFTQADRSLAHSAGGLGIGLALANRLVQLHGGTIEAHSPPKERQGGTEIIVRLPLSKSAPHWEADPASHSLEQTMAPHANQGIRVLVVDDNVDLVATFAISLRLKGYSVRTAHNGPDGLNIARTWLPDVMLLDIGLPGMDGYQVARRLRADPATQGIRLIAVSGYGREADIELGRKAGFDAHMVKPCDLDELEKLMTPRDD